MDFRKSLLLGFLLLGLMQSGFAKPSTPADSDLGDDDAPEDLQADDDYQYNDEDDNQSGQDRVSNKESNSVNVPLPYFDLPEYTTTVRVGDRVSLDCNIRNPSPTNVVMWYYNTTGLLFQNQIRMRQEPRYTIDTNHTLTIVDVQSSDNSEYRCTVLPNQVTLIAKLVVLTKPTANIYGSDGRDITNSSITVHQGEHVEFECKGAGRPEPAVKWFADGARVSNAHGVHVSDGIMLIDSADHHHVRTYQCLTDNAVSVGHASLNVIVQHSPKVSSHQRYVNTAIGNKVDLRCNYNTSSSETVTWTKEGNKINVDNREKYELIGKPDVGQAKTTLVVKSVSPKDLGEYRCEVHNKIGNGHSIVKLSLAPELAQFIRADVNDGIVTTHWMIHSMQPLVEVMLNYQKNGSKNWLTEKPIHHERSTEHSGIWKIQHKLSLDAGQWHARVKSKNSEGWSEYSERTTIIVHPTYESFEPEYEDTISSDNSSASNLGFSATAATTCLASLLLLLLRRN